VKGKVFLRYVTRMLKAGVLTDGELRTSDEGVPQGSICSPILANVFAHYVVDKWFQEVVKNHLRVKLKRVSEWARIASRRYRLGELWRRFRVKLLGHIRYYGVSFNGRDVGKFLNSSVRILYKWLERRSQRKSLTWEQFQQFIRANPLPVVKIYHKLY
jgi:hypothetical protein